MILKIIIEIDHNDERCSRNIFCNKQFIVSDGSTKNCPSWKYHIRNTWHKLKDKTEIDEEVYQYLINNSHI